MLRNYLTTGLNALGRNRVFAAINIFGLAIGMAACILLLLFVRYETSYDQWLPGHANAYQVQTSFLGNNTGRSKQSQISAYVVGRSLAKDFPQIDKVAYAADGQPVIIQNGVATTGKVLAAEPDFLAILQLPLVSGDARTALRNANSLLLTEAEAARRYPGVDPMGKTLSIVSGGKTIDYTVTGVLRDLPKNSHLAVTMIAAFSRLPYADRPDFFTRYGWNAGYNYISLRPGASVAAINQGIPAWEKRNIPKEAVGDAVVSEGDDVDWKLVPVADVHLSGGVDGNTASNDPKTIATFALVALLILGMACINFTNLATARAGQRAREVALRKVMGASRRQLITQFLGESLVVAALSMLVALVIAELALPALSDFLDADLSLHYFGQGGILLPVIGLVIVVGLAAGLYPAFVLSRFDPAPVLKSNRSGADTQGKGSLRNILVIGQFAVSIALVICTAIVTAQTIYARSSDPGYNRAGLLQVTGIGRRQLEGVADQIVTATAAIPGVEAVGRTSIGVNTSSSINTSVRIDGNPLPINLGNYNVDPGFFAAMDLKPLAGRLLDAANPRDDIRIAHGDDASEAELAARGTNTVITTEAMKKLGFKTPADAVGKVIRVSLTDDKYGLTPVTIVGVVADLRLRSLRDPYDPIMFYYDRSYMTEMMVRIKAGEAGAIREKVEAVWKRYAPQVPFQAQFTDDIVREQYDADEARAKTFAAFAGLAIIVACLGLYGLAAFTAERRTREIGIRKVLGARDHDIVRLLVWQFSQPVLLANIIAWPVAWWLMRDWLDTFDARIDLGPHWFIGAGLLAAIIAAATIIGHALKVARRSPALALRYE
ncbi:MAG: ABC transporter permease [Polymorphobacter sp.]